MTPRGLPLTPDDILRVQNEMIRGTILVLEGIAESTTDAVSRHHALSAIDALLHANELLAALLERADQTLH